ncbi:MAG: HD domain-containing protein [Vallitaleaceae bacterium]|jgi:putative nucleotidyltransferase with HDIG domain|nr:HD domain-containing protein [Vallitaleaceae bacterium]
MITREVAYGLLTEYVSSDSLIKHCLAVEASMRKYAKVYGEDVELYGITGLLHDIDFEQYPDEHPTHARSILQGSDIPESVLDAIEKHGKEHDNTRESLLAKTLFAVDSLSSFVIAYVHVRPDKSFEGVSLKSIKKKFKDKAFARAVNRDLVALGAVELDIELYEHMQTVIDGIVERQAELSHMGMSLI